MTEPSAADDSLQAQLAALRADGAQGMDPVRFAMLETLARRLAGQPEAVRTRLEERAGRQLGDLAARWAAAPRGWPPRREAAARSRPETTTPLAGLSHGGAKGELASVQRVREAVSRTQLVDRVQQVLARKPRNAGPLNSHTLVLQTLAALQAASPDYLRRTVDLLVALDALERLGTPGSAPRKPRTSAAATRRR